MSDDDRWECNSDAVTIEESSHMISMRAYSSSPLSFSCPSHQRALSSEGLGLLARLTL